MVFCPAREWAFPAQFGLALQMASLVLEGRPPWRPWSGRSPTLHRAAVDPSLEERTPLASHSRPAACRVARSADLRLQQAGRDSRNVDLPSRSLSAMQPAAVPAVLLELATER